MNKNFSIIFILAIADLAFGFFETEKSFSEENKLDSFHIDNFDDFPSQFAVKAVKKGQTIEVNLTKAKTEFIYPDVYVIDKNGSPKKYYFKKSEDFQHYIDSDGNAYATLIKNNNSDGSYRFIGRIFSKTEANTTYDIYPVKITEKQKRLNKKNEFQHAIKKRSTVDEPKKYHGFSDQIKNKDYIKKRKKSKASNKKLTKSGTGQTLVFNLETIIVADSSLIDEHKRISKSEDLDIVFNNLKIYLSHVMHAVDQKYQNSFRNDAEMKINILLTNFVFINNPTETPWVDPNVVGDPNNPSFEGQDVIVATPTIQSFKNYMESMTFPFEYDHAMALFKKDLWADGNDIPDNRKGVAGFAYVSGTCEDIRYSVTEEQGGFSSIFTIAHEIGHNLGSIHDGEPGAETCPLTDYFIMTPVQNFDKIQNMQKFSTCSIAQFKTTLILNGATTSNSVCMTNVPGNLPVEFQNANYSLTGQLYSLNDQCKMIHGDDASFCHFKSSEICSKLWCRKSNNDAFCWSSTPAAEGTTCGSGNICSLGLCVTSQIIPQSVCPFGDDLVQNGTQGITLSTNFVDCSEFITTLQQKGMSEASFCTSSTGTNKCCSTCLRYRYNNCTDKYSNCYEFKNSCETGSFGSGPVKEECCVTCETRPIKCETNANICQNGGTCSNTNTVSNLIGYTCLCSEGFEGFNCEKKSFIPQSTNSSSKSSTNEPSLSSQNDESTYYSNKSESTNEYISSSLKTANSTQSNLITTTMNNTIKNTAGGSTQNSMITTANNETETTTESSAFVFKNRLIILIICALYSLNS